MRPVKLKKWVQPTLREWDCIETEIERSKIKRYPYKKLLECSLTRYIHLLKEDGLSSHQVFFSVLRDLNIIKYMKENEQESDNMKHNIWVSVCARFSESKTYDKIKSKKCKLSRG